MSEHRIDQSDGNDDRTRAGVEDAMTVSCPRRSPETVSDRLGPEQGSVGAQEVAEEEASKDVRQREHVDVNLSGSETRRAATTTRQTDTQMRGLEVQPNGVD